MTLQLATPPEQVYGMIADALSRLSLASGAADRVTRVADPSRLAAALPHRVYTLRSTDIVRLRNLDVAHLVAWRFLIEYGGRTLAAIEFSCNVLGGDLRFASLDTGPFAQGTADAVRLVEQVERVEAGSYELRVLKAPSVYTMALWLHNLDAGDDIVLPIMPAGSGPLPATGGSPLAQSPSQFLGDLRSAAETTLRSGAAAPPPDSPGPDASA